jgi:DNA-binding MarR family transcriptional regulator
VVHRPRRRATPIFASRGGVVTELRIATAYRTHRYTLAQITEHLGVHYSTVSRRLRKLERT